MKKFVPPRGITPQSFAVVARLVDLPDLTQVLKVIYSNGPNQQYVHTYDTEAGYVWAVKRDPHIEDLLALAMEFELVERPKLERMLRDSGLTRDGS